MNSEKNRQQPIPIRSALLTTGEGFIPMAVYQFLRKETDLRAIVLSSRTRPIKRTGILKEAGLWYFAQHSITALGNRLFSQSIMRSDREINKSRIILWRSACDTKTITSRLTERGISLVVVAGFHYILDHGFRAHFDCCVNIHSSLLPAYRGPEPLAWYFLEREKQLGITLHIIDDGIDSGAIVTQQAIRRPVLPLILLAEYKLAQVVPALLREFLTRLRQNDLDPRPQTGGFYLPVPTKANRKKRHKLYS